MVISWDPFLKPADISDMKKRKDFRGLIRALRHRDLNIQWEASQALADLGSEGMDHLLAGLRPRNKNTRLGIIYALGEIKDPRAVEPLVSLLNDKNNEIRWMAALALGEIGDIRTIDPLKTSLKDTDRHVRYGAAVALEKLQWSPADSQEYAFLLAGKQEWDALFSLGNAAVSALSLLATDNEKSVRINAIRTLGKIQEEKAGPTIYRALSDSDDQVRWEAVLAAPKCGISPKFIPRGLAKRPPTRKNPLIAGFLNFALPGIGYFWLGKWWGLLIFQIDIYATLWIFNTKWQSAASWDYLLPIYLLLAIHGWYIARQMPDL
jgi:HEAT repeat protein